MKLKYSSVRREAWKTLEANVWKEVMEKNGLDTAKLHNDIGEILLPMKFTVRNVVYYL